MAHQSPMISIPKKTTEDVDWTTPIRNLIAQSYGENPDNYATEYNMLQRCRQDAVRGAGSDLTARDLLYKYFGQLELLELRFSEMRVNFPWHDAFTKKLITQTSVAYEKASILFQIAATHSAIAASQNRSDPEGLKRSYHYFRTCAGMLTYINENFLHAPSTDLSREVIKFLVNVILAQATEIFFEKSADEKKGNALVAKIGAQAAFLYTSLSEEVKEFLGKGILDRNWVTLIQIKSKYFQSLSQYHRALADTGSGKHGDALARFTLAENLAKEASRNASFFAPLFTPTVSPNLPADAGPSLQDRTKAHLALCTDRKAEAERENDLIYNAIVPVADALPPIDKMTIATLIPIQEVFGAQEVQKVIGSDFFGRLIPLSVHESASVYSEEKAKLVRAEVEKAESADGEARSALDGIGIRDGLARFKAIAEGGMIEELPVDAKRWKEDIALTEEREPVEKLMAQLNQLKGKVQQELETVSKGLDNESRECERMRVKYEHLWTQEPSISLAKSLRQDLKAHFGALEAATSSDQQVQALWDSVRADVGLLLSDEIVDVFRASAEQTGVRRENLLDLDVGTDPSDASERAKVGALVDGIEERLTRLMKISKERNEVLKDLKEKIQTDDVSHLLLLNRRNSGVEPKLFAAELEKFRPYQQRLASTVHHQQVTLQEINGLWKSLKDLAGRGPGAKKWEEREKRKKDTVRRFSRARDCYMEVRDGLAKGLQFYGELTQLSGELNRNASSFITNRKTEREALASQAEIKKQLSASKSPPAPEQPPLAPRPPPAPRPTLESSFSSMTLVAPPIPPPPPKPSQPTGIPVQQYHNPPSQYNPSPQPPPSQYNPSPQPPPSQYNPLPQPPPSQYNPSPQPPPSQYNSSPQPPQTTTYLPSPPPQPIPHQPYSSAPPPDPYASLGAFEPTRFMSPQNAVQPQPPPPPPPPPLPASAPPSLPPHPHTSYMAQPPQQTYPTSSFPPPPQPITYSHAASAPHLQSPQLHRQGSYPAPNTNPTYYPYGQ